MANYSTDREVRKILAQAEAAGWRISGGGSSHFKCYSPDGVTIITVSCTSDTSGRRIHNIKAQFRRAGLKLK